MRNPKETALDPYGQALRDFADGDPSTTIVVHSDLGEHDELPISFFFRDPANFFPGEQEMLDLCTGTVLDLGAGTGVDTLALQERGLAVTALEVVPAAVEIMRERGVQNPVCADMFEFETEPVDTILMMMNGIGPVGTLKGLDRFLARTSRFLRSGGQILVDSGAAQPQEETADSPHVEFPPRDGDYPGEAWIRLEYGGAIGAPFRELYVDFDTLSDRANQAGWKSEIVRGERDEYSARLTLRRR